MLKPIQHRPIGWKPPIPAPLPAKGEEPPPIVEGEIVTEDGLKPIRYQGGKKLDDTDEFVEGTNGS